MPLQQILRKREQVHDNLGNPLAGGLVYCYDPGTTDFVAMYSDSALSSQYTADTPVTLSGDGRAEIWVDVDCDVRITDADGNLVCEELNANPEVFVAGSFTATLSGVDPPIEATVRFVKSGRRVTLYRQSNMRGTADGTAVSMSGVPASIRPQSGTLVYPTDRLVNNNSTGIAGVARVHSSQDLIEFFVLDDGADGVEESAFAGTNDQGLDVGWSLSYVLPP